MAYTARQKLQFLELAQNRLIEKETTGKDKVAASPKLVHIYISLKIINSHKQLFTSLHFIPWGAHSPKPKLAQKTCVNTS